VWLGRRLYGASDADGWSGTVRERGGRRTLRTALERRQHSSHQRHSHHYQRLNGNLMKRGIRLSCREYEYRGIIVRPSSVAPYQAVVMYNGLWLCTVVNLGVERGEGPPRTWRGKRWCKLSPRLCHVSKYQASYCLHYNAVKAYQPRNPDSVFTILPKRTSQRSPSHHFTRKIQHFSGEDTDKNTAQNSPKQVDFFLGRGLAPSSDPYSAGEG